MKKLIIGFICIITLSFLMHILQATCVDAGTLIAPEAKLEIVGENFKFTEGPAVDAKGDLFFTDIRATRIYKLPLKGKLTVFQEDTGGANGLFFDNKGNLLAGSVKSYMVRHEVLIDQR